MTRMTQRQENAKDNATRPTDPPCGPTLSQQPTSASTSDNDTSEKPVREKLKKASLASISKITTVAEPPTTQPTDSVSAPADAVPIADNPKVGESRGRPIRKRSFEHVESSEKDHIAIPNDEQPEPRNGHIRKRSREVHTGGFPKAESNPLEAVATPVQEEVEEKETEEDIHAYSENIDEAASNTEITGVGATDTPVQVLPVAEPIDEEEIALSETGAVPTLLGGPPQGKSREVDQDMQDGAYSPRKKRSRDHLDTDADREQKIVATEEARAQRRSDELERVKTPKSGEHDIITAKDSVADPKLNLSEENADVSLQAVNKDPPKSTFGQTSALKPLPGPPRGSSPGNSSKAADSTMDEQSEASSAAFAASGFAALSGSSASPFGTLSTSTTSPFVPSPALGPPKTDDQGATADRSASSSNNGFDSFAKTSSSAFGSTGPSPLAASAPAKTGVFGGSVFGGTFGGGFAAGSKLTSFAAPTGDAKLGVGNGVVKPIGSPKHLGEGDEENSEGEEEDTEENGKEDGDDEVDERFQHQGVETGEDGEESIFSARASLYSFKDNAWKESGKGIFKFNVPAVSPEEAKGPQTKGRFIMRAHQTYRVLLNAPVFKQMKIGDSKGNEPSGKSIAIAVIEDGKPTPYMVKLGDVTESRALWQSVRALQQELD